MTRHTVYRTAPAASDPRPREAAEGYLGETPTSALSHPDP
jgi:hypothetical protein